MKRNLYFLFGTLALIGSLCLVAFPGCTKSALPESASELTVGSPNQTYGIIPPYNNPELWGSVPRCTAAELKEKIDNKEKMLLVDVRTAEEYAVNHLSGAISVPSADIVSGKWLPTGSADDQIVIY